MVYRCRNLTINIVTCTMNWIVSPYFEVNWFIIFRFRVASTTNSFQLTPMRIRMVLVAIWLYSLAVSSPLYVWSAVQNRSLCIPAMEGYSKVDMKVFVVFTRIANFIVPLCLTWVCYVGVVYRIKKSTMRVFVFLVWFSWIRHILYRLWSIPSIVW